MVFYEILDHMALKNRPLFSFKHRVNNFTKSSWSICLITWVFLSLPLQLFAQEIPKITARHIDSEITLDGVMDEPVWQSAETGDNFWQFFPTDSIRRKNKTEFKILYNDHTIYVGIYAEAVGNKYAVTGLRRDFSGNTNDNVSLMFDTFRDGNNAFLFGATPYGVQREALISEGGDEGGFNRTWDMKWMAESKMHDNYFVIEMAIPFTSLKFKEGDTKWRLQCYRWDFQTNEQSAWARVPQNQLLSSLAFMGELYFEKPLGKSRTPFAVIPYINGLSQKDFEIDEGQNDLKFGGDAKIAIGDGLNLDLTVNPDFSTVEVDDIFTNLTRFEVFLPEKRQFFIDNNDLFGSFGSIFQDEYPFFSRRIGLARDTVGNLIENRIIAGARLSGKLNQNLRLGFLNIQTDEDIANEIPSNNDMMFVLQQKVFSRSNIGVFAINRQAFKDYEFLEESDRYNRVIGADFNLASRDNKWTGKYYLHKSFQPNDNQGNYASQAATTYNTRHFRYTNDLIYINEDFRSDLGFVPRKDFLRMGNSFEFRFYPKKGIINTHSINPLPIFYWKPSLDFKKTDHEYRLSWSAEFKNQAVLEVLYTNSFIYLINEFDPTRSDDGVPLPSNKGYTFNFVNASYQSNPAKLFTISGETTLGEFFTGNRFSLGGEMAYRFQPWVILSLAFNYDQIRLPDPHSDADYWLLAPKVDVTFNKELFWSTLVQYSNQRENLGINSRLQWRYAPLSDIYLVYNDNYYTSNFSPKYRSINLKVTYWLNI